MTVVGALLLAFLLGGSGAQGAEVETYRVGPAARNLSFNRGAKVLAAAQALGGVTFLKIEDGKVVAQEFHQEWQTLHALPLEDGAFLLADRFAGIRLVAPAQQGTFGTYGEKLNFPCEGIPTHLVVDKDRLLVAAGGAGLLLYEWPLHEAAPMLRGRFPFVDYTKEIVLDGRGMAYLADNFETGLQIIDQRDLMRPKLMALRSGGFFDSVAIHGELLAVANRRHGLQLWNVQDPAKPELMQAVMLEAKGFPKSITFGSEGKLVLCHGGGGAFLYEPRVKNGVLELKADGRITPDAASALHSVFLSPGLIVVSSERGELFFCRIGAQ